jgi:hypothetical protein
MTDGVSIGEGIETNWVCWTGGQIEIASGARDEALKDERLQLEGALMMSSDDTREGN